MKQLSYNRCVSRVAALAGAVFSTTAFAAEISSTTLRAKFDEQAKGRLTSLVDESGRDYVSPRNVNEPLWQAYVCRANDFTKKLTVRGDSAKKFSVERRGDTLYLTWEDVGPTIASAVATIRAAEGDPSLRCRITVTPKPGWALFETQFPLFAMNERLGDTATDDAIVMGTGHGGLVRYPMNPRRIYWRHRLYGHSPGNLVAQFGSFFDDRGGLFTMAEDAAGNEKELLMDRWWRATRKDGTYFGGKFLFRWSRCEYSETTDAQPYDILIRGFKGADGEPTTWYDAADLYKAWAVKQFWCKKTFLEKTDFLPAWTREAPVVMGFNRRWFDRPEFLKRWLETWKEKSGGAPLVAILEGWEHHGDWITTEYFPIYPSEERFAEMIGWMKNANAHAWPWPGGHHWNVQVGKKPDGTFRLDFLKDFEARVAPHAVVGPDGQTHYDDLCWLGGGKSASLCPADQWTIDWWNKDVAAALVKRGCDMVQADQDVGARIPLCWSRKHGHKPGPGIRRLAEQRHQFETMLEEMRKINPEALFSFEEMHEFFNDIYAFCDYRNCRYLGPEWASVWNYLYHEYVPPFQSGSEQYSRWHWLAFCAADGQMPRLPIDPALYAKNEDPLFPNGNFERLTGDGVGFAEWEKPEAHAVAAEDAKEGKYALRIDATKVKRLQIARNVNSEIFWMPGKTYRVSLWAKGEKGRGNINVAALSRKDNKYVGHGTVTFAIPKPEAGWQHLSKEFTITPGSGFVRFMLNANLGDSYLVDDVRFEVKGDDGKFVAVTRCRGSERELMDFVESWIKLYRGEGRKFLAHGKALHPPKVDCETVAYEENFRGDMAVNDKPSVYANAWEAADGTRALVFANATGYVQPIAYRWNGVWTRTTIKPREIRLVQVK